MIKYKDYYTTFYNKSDHSLVAADVTILQFTFMTTYSLHIVKLKKYSLTFFCLFKFIFIAEAPDVLSNLQVN